MQFKSIAHSSIFIFIICMLFVACNQPESTSTPTAIVNITDTPPPNCVEPTVKILGSPEEAFAHEEVRLAADAEGDDLTYFWTAVSGTFTNPEAKIATYIAPDNVTNDTITLTINSACDSIEKIIELNIIPSTATPEPTPTTTPTPTNTSTITPSNTPSPTLTPTRPSIIATPTSVSGIPPINLAEPTDNTCVGGGSSATFRWEWSWALNDIEGDGGDYFALNIWSDDTEERSATWIKTNYYTVSNPKDRIVVYTQLVDCTQESGCYWNVNVIRAYVPPGQGHLPNSHTVIAKSPIRNFCVDHSDLFPQFSPTSTPKATDPVIEPTWTPPPTPG